jgi:hypothetical protein
MKILRILIPLVLILAATPMFACTFCDFDCGCKFVQGGGVRCRATIDCCKDVVASCFSDGTEAPADLAAQYKIASVEVLAVDASKAQVQVAERQQTQPSSVETASLRSQR